MSQRNSSVLPILIGSSVLSAGIVASASACIRNIDSKSVSGPSLYLASGTGESFALLLDPQFASIYFHSAKFYFKRLASLTGWDLPAPTSLLARLFSGSWKAHYFLVLQGIHKDNGTVHWMRIDYSCDGLSVQLGENEEDIVSSVEHEMGTGVGDVHPADGWCTAEEVAGWLARGQWERDDYVLTGRDTHNCQTFTEAFRSWFIRTPS